MVKIDVVLILACFAYIAFLGFLVMDRIDRYFSANVEKEKKDDSRIGSTDIVLFLGESGEPGSGELPGFLPGICIKGPSDIGKYSRLKYLLALSRSDFENLTVSSVAKKQNDGVSIIAVCNEPENMALFHTLEIQTVPREHATPDYLASIIDISEKKKVGKTL